ncbi:MAG: NUDIX hydrolase [Oscillospiraceae bacterium]|nr:NUDIX hydrolase [Oscillospiraceae bacterium]
MKRDIEEQKFLESYDPAAFPPVAVAVDAVVFGVSKTAPNNYRKLGKQSLNILLVKRSEYPFKDKLSLPGGFVLPNETLDETAKRVLKAKTGLDEIYCEQLYTFGDISRDPRMRVISCAYIALVDAEKTRINGAEWVSIDTIKSAELAFDHTVIITEALDRLRGKIDYTDIVFHMMPEKFTISQLQEIYETVLEKKLLPAAFRRVIADKITQTEEFSQNAGHRPARLYRWNGAAKDHAALA